jgi:hypothetical protein
VPGERKGDETGDANVDIFPRGDRLQRNEDRILADAGRNDLDDDDDFPQKNRMFGTRALPLRDPSVSRAALHVIRSPAPGKSGSDGSGKRQSSVEGKREPGFVESSVGGNARRKTQAVLAGTESRKASANRSTFSLAKRVHQASLALQGERRLRCLEVASFFPLKCKYSRILNKRDDPESEFRIGIGIQNRN